MLKKFNVTNYENVQFIQDQTSPFILIIAQSDEYNYSYQEEIGRFNFYTMEGYLQLLNGTRKEYKRFNSLLNNFFNYKEMFSWNSKVVEDCKVVGVAKKNEDKKELASKEKQETNEKVNEYLTKLNNNDEKIIELIQTKLMNADQETITTIINNSFKNATTEQINTVLTAILNKINELNNTPEVEETTEETTEEQQTTSYIAYNKTFSTFAEAYEYCKSNEYDYLYIREVPFNEENNEQVPNEQIENISYIVANRKFGTYEEAYNYCLQSDFDPDLMIEKVAFPESSQNVTESHAATETTEQPEVFYFYNQTFSTYMDAYNYALNNMSPVTMVISSKHPTMTTERLQQLEKEYVFSKHNMSYDDMKEYFEYISSCPETLDQQDRYYKLKSNIQRYENKQKSIKEREEYLRNLSVKAAEMLQYMCDNGLEIKSNSSYVQYLLNGSQVHIWFSGISTEEYYKGVEGVYNKYFAQSKAI